MPRGKAGDGERRPAAKYMQTDGSGIGHWPKRSLYGSAVTRANSAFDRTARAFAQHSVRALNGDSEGTAVSVLEAAACGLPVIATSHAGIKDSMVDRETGFLVPELDIEGMTRGMVKLLSDATLARELGQNGRNRMIRKFSLERSIGLLYDLLRECGSDAGVSAKQSGALR